jgi:hypothetical protein
MPDISPQNVWPEVAAKRVARAAAEAYVIEATTTAGGRVALSAPATANVAWFTNSTETTVRFSLQDSSSAGGANAVAINDRVVLYGGTSS